MLKHTLIAEFDKENKEGWESFSRQYEKSSDAQQAYADVVADPSCVRAVLEIRRIYNRKG